MFDLIGHGLNHLHQQQKQATSLSSLKAAHQAATDKREFWPGHWHMAALLHRAEGQRRAKDPVNMR